MPTRAQASTIPPADRGLLTAWRRLTQGRAALTALAATAALGAGASPASAAEWGYEQITPADSNSLGVNGVAVSKDLSTVLARTRMVPMPGMPWDGRTGVYSYGLPHGGKPWTLGPVAAGNGSMQITHVSGMSPDGSRMLFSASIQSLAEPNSIYRVDGQGPPANMSLGLPGATVTVGSDDVETIAFRLGTGSVYVGRAETAPIVASVDNDGAPMTTTTLGGSSTPSFFDGVLKNNALSGDGSSVIFGSVDGLPGDNDGGFNDLYRRVLTPGAQETILISDANGSGDADGGFDAAYRWATADHQRVFFVTKEPLEAGDTDDVQDLYVRAGTSAPVRVSQGELVDGSLTGNATGDPNNFTKPDAHWVMSSQDGNRTFFATIERLTQDAPAGDDFKLYERDVAEGRTRFVAGPLSNSDLNLADFQPEGGSLVGLALQDLSKRGIRVTPDGAVFMSSAPLLGSADDNSPKVFVWSRGGGLVRISKPEADAPPSPAAAASIIPHNASGEAVDPLNELQPLYGGRGMSDDGSRVFLTTAESLTAKDTDGGYRDVYMWTAADGGLSLVTPPGSAPADLGYLDSSPDGTKVFFNTAETILPSDTDPGAVDVYLAILGGGSAPSKPGPDVDPEVCRGEACQGRVGNPVAPPSIGSLSFAGFGNLPATLDSVTPSVGVGKVKAVTGSVATVKVTVPNAGRISVAGGSLRSAGVSASKAGTYSVRIALSSAAKRSLKKKKTLKVSARVSYRADDGDSVSKTVSVTFKQPKAATKKGGR
jgi:hypothetical protein